MTDLISRRTALASGLTAAATLALAGCATTPAPAAGSSLAAAITRTERRRRSTGAVRRLTLEAAEGTLDLGGRTASTWSFGSIPHEPVRITAGDTLQATLRNRLPVATSIHWHGIALRNDMDGVPPSTQPAVRPGASFTYRFIAERPGTYWFHPHVGTELDRGLYGALVVEDPKEPLSYDQDWVVVLDDWLDGVSTNPDRVLRMLERGMSSMGGMGGMGGMLTRNGDMLMGATSRLLGGDAGDVYYPYYLINGRPATDPATFRGKPGDRVRFRIINAGGDTAFRVALGGHRLTVTHTDGYPVQRAEADSVLIGMGERYDVVTTLASGAFPLVAAAEGKQDAAFAVVRTAAGAAPARRTTLPELDRAVARAGMLTAAPEVRLPQQQPDRTIRWTLSGSMMKYDWAINGRRFDSRRVLDSAARIREGERVRIEIANTTKMWHPMHLHGHTWQHAGGGPRKDTSIVLPGETLRVDFDADNPGDWIAHCHNIYHAEAGMMTALTYRA